MRLLVGVLCLLCSLSLFGQVNPLSPKGFTPPAPREHPLGPPDPSLKDEHRIYWKRFGAIKMSGSRVQATEGVEFQYRGYTVRADQAEGDVEEEQFTLRGKVTLHGADQVVSGEEVWVDFKNKTYRFTDGRADFRPSFFEGRLLSSLYGTALGSEGSERHVSLHEGSVTTCSLDHPHFTLAAKEIEIDPGDRAILRHVRLTAFERTLLTLRHFALPLDRPDYRGYLPDVGRSELEGVYVKSRFGASMFGNDKLTVRVEAMEKRGLGLGVAQDWKDGNATGAFTVHTLYDQARGQNTFTGDFFHSDRLGKLDLQTRVGLRQNSYLSMPDTRSIDGNICLRYGTVFLNYLESRNTTGDFTSHSRTVALSETRRVGAGFSTSARITYSDYCTQRAGQTLSEREQADLNFGIRYTSRAFDTELSYQRLVPIRSSTTFRTSFERTPVLTLRTDTSRLLGRTGPPLASLEASIGEYADGFRGVRVVREGFAARGSRSVKQGAGWSLGYSSEFAQSFQSDGTAQYILNQTLEARYGLSAKTDSEAVLLRYRYLRPYGYSPLLFDRRGEVNSLALLGDIPLGKSLSLRVGGGYDFLLEKRGQVAWNTVGAALRYRPSPDSHAILSSSYDPRDKVWTVTRLRVDWQFGDTLLQAEGRFDGRRNKWGNLNLRLEGFRFGKTKTSLLLLYNGYLERFDTQQLQLTYDLHCAEAILGYRNTLTGYRRGQELQFFIRLKALPSRSDFGLGVSGEPLDTSTGVDY